MYPTEQNEYIKNIYVNGNDGRDYRFEFFQLTNGTDIEIHQFVKDINNKWKSIEMDVNKCIQRYRFHHEL